MTTPEQPERAAAERAAVAWLETVGTGMLETLQAAPDETIVPSLEAPSTGGGRALAAFLELASGALGATAKLRPAERIGEGGMGVIHAAEQVALGRTVAVKTLKDPGDSAATLDLLREAWITGSIEHPNVVPVHDVVLDDRGVPAIVLKRIEGVEWRRLLGDAAEIERRFGARDVLAWNLGILMQVLNAVRFAHARGIVHRDLKPSNVMIGDYGEVYLLDWGIAVSLRDDPSGRLPRAVDAKRLAGTPHYMAPEMLGRDGAPPISARTDVYLAGAILHELITGRPPHADRDPLRVVASIVASRPELPPSVPAELARICTRAMAAEPADRFESAEALRLAVQRYLEHRGSDQLAERAHARYQQLVDVLSPSASGMQRHHEEIYRLFGACRSGFHDALAVWPDNEDARTGLTAATIAVAEYELSADNPAAAVALLGELPSPPPVLETAREAAAAQARRRAELERLGRQYDPKIGTRTRTFLVAMFGLFFTIGPLVAGISGMSVETRELQLGFSAGWIGAIACAAWWARESLLATLINRRLAASAVLLFVLQIVLGLGGWILGMSLAHTLVLQIFLYAVMAAMVAVMVDVRFAISAVGYVSGFLIAARWPAHRFFVVSAANLVFTVNAVWLWRPAQMRYSAEEREARRARRSEPR